MIPQFKRCPWPRTPCTHKPGYGKRKARKDARRWPLFAGDPSIVYPPETYEARVDAMLARSGRAMRHWAAVDWWTIRRWLQRASPEKRARWTQRWTGRWSVPHDHGWAVHVAWQIDVEDDRVAAGADRAAHYARWRKQYEPQGA